MFSKIVPFCSFCSTHKTKKSYLLKCRKLYSILSLSRQYISHELCKIIPATVWIVSSCSWHCIVVQVDAMQQDQHKLQVATVLDPLSTKPKLIRPNVIQKPIQKASIFLHSSLFHDLPNTFMLIQQLKCSVKSEFQRPETHSSSCSLQQLVTKVSGF